MPLSTSAPTVLVVEEDIGLRLSVGEALNVLGMRVEQASDARQALEKLDRSDLALVLFDLRNAATEDREALRELCRRRPDVPALVLVDPISPSLAASLMQDGASEVHEKPVDPVILRATATRLLDRDARVRRRQEAYRERIELAEAAIRARRLEAALAHTLQAMSLDGTRPEPFNLMGIIAQLRMDLIEAQRLYRTALALEDTYEPARRNLENVSGFPKKLSLFFLT